MKTRYYLDFEESGVWIYTNEDTFVCIAASPNNKAEIGSVIKKPILPGHWKPLESNIKFSDIVLSKTKPALY